jgi:hypothetical protein
MHSARKEKSIQEYKRKRGCQGQKEVEVTHERPECAQGQGQNLILCPPYWNIDYKRRNQFWMI